MSLMFKWLETAGTVNNFPEFPSPACHGRGLAGTELAGTVINFPESEPGTVISFPKSANFIILKTNQEFLLETSCFDRYNIKIVRHVFSITCSHMPLFIAPVYLDDDNLICQNAKICFNEATDNYNLLKCIIC